nr:spermatogenesis-associated serine-rich protein 1 isoform X2 [Odocoileus virginianus texanus]
MDAGSGPGGCRLRPLYSRDLKKVQDKGDSDIITGEKRYNMLLKVEPWNERALLIDFGGHKWANYSSVRWKFFQQQCTRMSFLQAVPALGLSDTKHSDLLESKGCFANVTSSGRRVSSSSTETGLSVGKPLSPCRGLVHLDPAAELDLKSSSSHSDHSSETSLPEVQKDKYPQEFSLLKLQTKDGQRPEWTFYPRFSSNIHTYHVGKQCFFNGVFLGNRRSLSERIVDKSLGRKKYVLDPRNGIPKLTPGDNPYMYPEQSKGFHKAGSTLPPVNFSIVPYEKKFDTFIPLEPLPQIPNLPFWVKHKANMLKSEIREVKELDDWQPAISLLHSLLPAGSLDFPRQS